MDIRPSRGPDRPETAVARAHLEERVFSVKKRFLAMYRRAHAGHIGSSLSCAEILVFLKYAWMSEEDVFLLSKGHAVAALYALLAEVGTLSPGELDSFYAEGTHLPALPPVGAIEGIPFATGSLGHGLSLSAGMALGARLNGRARRVYCTSKIEKHLKGIAEAGRAMFAEALAGMREDDVKALIERLQTIKRNLGGSDETNWAPARKSSTRKAP